MSTLSTLKGLSIALLLAAGSVLHPAVSYADKSEYNSYSHKHNTAHNDAHDTRHKHAQGKFRAVYDDHQAAKAHIRKRHHYRHHRAHHKRFKQYKHYRKHDRHHRYRKHYHHRPYYGRHYHRHYGRYYGHRHFRNFDDLRFKLGFHTGNFDFIIHD